MPYHHRYPPVSRALIVSLLLHTLLFLIIALVLRDSFLLDAPVEPSVEVVFVPPHKPQTMQLRLRLDVPDATPRSHLAKALAAPVERKPEAIRAKQLAPSRRANVVPPRHNTPLFTAEADQLRLATDADLRPTESPLTPSSAGMVEGSGWQGDGPTRSPAAPTDRSLIELGDAGEDDDDVMPFVEESGSADLPVVRMDQVIRTFAQSIVAQSGGGPIDVVFVIDYSGSMQDNIDAVQEHFNEMIDVYERSKLDYALGLVQFHVIRKENDIRLYHPTRRWRDIRNALSAIHARGDEHAFDAVNQATAQIRYRPASRRFLILATDEPFTSSEGWKVEDAIAACKEFAVTAYVMGLDLPEHRRLAEETGGQWHLIPQKPRPAQRGVRGRSMRASSRRQAARFLRSATWKGLERIRQDALQPAANNQLDVLWVVDASRSMEDKLPRLMEEVSAFYASWDHALIDYWVGVLRFRSGAGSFDYLSFHAPHQDLTAIRKLLALPTEGSERLLDALPEGLERMPWRAGARRYVIVVTDEPSKGTNSPEAVQRMALQQKVTVSVIGTVDPFQQEIAAQTGGVWAPIPEGYTISQEAW